MGYTTDFDGAFRIRPALTPEQVAYLQAFAGTRRMLRAAHLTDRLPDPKREAVGLPVGFEGAYYVGDEENFGQNQSPDVLSFNDPPGRQAFETRFVLPDLDHGEKECDVPIYVDGKYQGGHGENHGCRSIAVALNKPAPPEQAQPGLWCQWVPFDDGSELAWDGGEKFYDYIEWLEYLMRHFLLRWDRTLFGEVDWLGEDPEDRGRITASGDKLLIYIPSIKWKLADTIKVEPIVRRIEL